MTGKDERVRRQMVGRLRGYLTRRRSPRAVLSGLLLLTAVAGFLASAVMLKFGLAEMWLRYPLAVLVGWSVFLTLMRIWAAREHEELVADDEMETLVIGEEMADEEDREGDKKRSGWLESLDWLNPFNGLAEDPEGCLLALALLVALVALGGAIFTLAGLILHAEVLLAELLLDVLLVSAFNKRLHRVEARWWLHGTLRQTVVPVTLTMIFLAAAGFALERSAPGSKTIGHVWEHWTEPQPD